MNTATTPRNKMTGFCMRGGLYFDDPLTELEKFDARFSLAATLQGKGQDDVNKRIGREMSMDAFHDLIEYCNTDPDHVNYADPRTPEQIDADRDAAEWRDTYASLLP